MRGGGREEKFQLWSIKFTHVDFGMNKCNEFLAQYVLTLNVFVLININYLCTAVSFCEIH